MCVKSVFLLSALLLVQGRPQGLEDNLKEAAENTLSQLSVMKHNLVQIRKNINSKEAIALYPNGCPVDPSVELLLPHETECDRYYQCNHGEKVSRPCAPGTHFNFDKQICDWPWIANCSTSVEDNNSEETNSSEENEKSEDNNSDNDKEDSSGDSDEAEKYDSGSSEDEQSSSSSEETEEEDEIKDKELKVKVAVNVLLSKFVKI